MLTHRDLHEAGIKDNWPELRSMGSNMKYYSFESSLGEIRRAVEYLDMLPNPTDLRLALTGYEPALVQLYHSNPIVHALITIGMQYERAKRLMIVDDPKDCPKCHGAQRIVPRTGLPPTPDEMTTLTTMPCDQCNNGWVKRDWPVEERPPSVPRCVVCSRFVYEGAGLRHIVDDTPACVPDIFEDETQPYVLAGNEMRERGGRIVGGSGTDADPFVVIYPEDEADYERLHGADN